MWKYPELIDGIIPWVAFAFLLHFTWEFILDTRYVKHRAAALQKAVRPVIAWLLVFIIGGAIGVLYWWTINRSISRLARIAAARVATIHPQIPSSVPLESTTRKEEKESKERSNSPKKPSLPAKPAPEEPATAPKTTIIQTQAPYGNLAARCEGLGRAIISTVEQRNKVRPDPATHGEEYKEWYRLNDGMFFHARFYSDVSKIQKELSAVHIDDPRLDELIERHEGYFESRQRNVQGATEHPEAYHLSIDDIREIGERFKFLATQVPK